MKLLVSLVRLLMILYARLRLLLAWLWRDPVAQAGALVSEAGIHKAAGRLRLALALAERAVSLTELAGPALMVVADTLLALGELEQARAAAVRCLAHLEASGEPVDDLRLQAELLLGVVMERCGELDQALEIYRSCLAEYQARGEPGSGDALAVRRNMAELLRSQGRNQEAELELRACLEGLPPPPAGPDILVRSSLRFSLGLVLRASGQLEEAEQLLRGELSLARAMGSGHPEYAMHLAHVAYVLALQGRGEEAEPMVQEALAIHRRLGMSFGWGEGVLAAVRRSRGLLDEADDLFALARVTCEGEGSPLATVIEDHAGLLEQLGRSEEAAAARLEAHRLRSRGR